jgi:hypothetical protein
MPEKDSVTLNHWEKQFLRKVYGPVTEQDFEESEIAGEICKTPDPVADNKKRRLELLGSVTRVDQT